MRRGKHVLHYSVLLYLKRTHIPHLVESTKPCTLRFTLFDYELPYPPSVRPEEKHDTEVHNRSCFLCCCFLSCCLVQGVFLTPSFLSYEIPSLYFLTEYFLRMFNLPLPVITFARRSTTIAIWRRVPGTTPIVAAPGNACPRVGVLWCVVYFSRRRWVHKDSNRNTSRSCIEHQVMLMFILHLSN